MASGVTSSQNQTDSSDYASIANEPAEYKESSNTSAYNTGESCNNTPLKLALKPVKTMNDGSGGWNMSMLSLAVSNVQNGGGRTPPSDDETQQQLRLQWCQNNSLTKQGLNRNTNSERKKRPKPPLRPRVREGSQKCPMVAPQAVSNGSHVTEQPTDDLRDLYTQYAEVMYTNQANLQHTMQLQQKLFQQQLLMQQAKQTKVKKPSTTNGGSSSPSGSKSREAKESRRHKSSASGGVADTTGGSKKKQRSQSSSNDQQTVSGSGTSQGHSKLNSPYSTEQNVPVHDGSSQGHGLTSLQGHGLPSLQGQQGSSGSDNKFEWVVKMRPDGSRYITRRPVRSKILRERARKLHEERCGMTTDDDAMSELKVGRYWSKDDRKRHLEKAREYKKKKELALKMKTEALRESDEKINKEPNILDLSHKKMMKSKNKKLIDDFTTVQEMLVHGNRRAEAVAKVSTNPLLSVTTV